jgi:flagellar motor switch/type III secretory pathway protein FliN
MENNSLDISKSLESKVIADTEGYIDDGNNNAEALINNDQLISPQDVDVNIRCTIGNINMSIDELLKLKLGDVIDFCRWPATVRLSVNNRFFAEGVLVEIEGFLGVKISRRLAHFN